jgi:magnesium transporter
MSRHHTACVNRPTATVVCGTVTDVVYGLDEVGRERVAALRGQGRFFWLDVSLTDTNRDDLADALAVPREALRALPESADASATRKFHADGDSVVFALRCYVESERPLDAARYRLRPVEVFVVVTSEYLLTVHRERLSLPDVLAPDLPGERTKQYVVYSVLDAMLASSFDALEEVEVRLDSLAATWMEGGDGRASRATIRESAARLATMRRWGGGELAAFERIGVELSALDRSKRPEEPYFDRLDEQVNRLLGSIDAAANAVGMLLDLQLNERAYLVSVVATVFLPLTLITGFFGMNFGWMVEHLDTPTAFWLLGLAVPVATGLLSWRLLVRRFLIGDRRPPGRG